MDLKYVMYALWLDYKQMKKPPVPFDRYALSLISGWYAEAVVADVRREGNPEELECPTEESIDRVIQSLEEAANHLFKVGSKYNAGRMENYRNMFLLPYLDRLSEVFPEIEEDEEINSFLESDA